MADELQPGAATPDLEALAHGADPEHREALGLTADQIVDDAVEKVHSEIAEHATPEDETAPDASMSELAPAEAEVDREAILRDLDEMQAKLNAMRARFEGVAAEDPVKPIDESPAVDNVVAAEAASTFAQPESPAPAQPDLIDGAPGVISGRSGVLNTAPVTPGWTEDPNRPGVLTRPVDESNPADVALRNKKIAEQQQFDAMSAAAVADARARNDQIAAAQAAAKQPLEGGIEVPEGMLRQVAPEASTEPQPIITSVDVPSTPEEATPAPAPIAQEDQTPGDQGNA